MTRYRSAIICCLLFLLTACSKPNALTEAQQPRDGTETLSTVVSIVPQAYFVERIAGSLASVEILAPPNHTAETHQVTPRQMDTLSHADVYFRIGMPFETTLVERLAATCPQLKIVDTREGVVLLGASCTHDDDEAEHHHHPEGNDPHIWLDPLRCIRMAENMAATLQQIDPAQFDFYAERLEHLRTELQQLHHDIEKILTPLQQRTFMVFHPSWGYFAARYNLQQIALEKDGKEPSGVHLARLIEQAQQEQIKVIFVQQQFSTKAARAIAAQTGARIETLDPLASDLADSLRRTARTLARSLAL